MLAQNRGAVGRASANQNPHFLATPARSGAPGLKHILKISLADFLKSWHLQTSSYERTPNLQDRHHKTQCGPLKPIFGVSNCRASVCAS